MLNRNLYQLFAVIIFITFASFYAFTIYPSNSWKKPLLNQFIESSFQHFLTIGELAKLDEVSSVFRSDFVRSGRYEGTILNKPKVWWKTEKLFYGIHSASKASPIIDKTGIYIGTDLGIFYRYSLEGKLIWSFESDAGPQGIHGSAILTDNYVYFGNYAGYFYCLEKLSGKLVWTTQVASAIGSSPLILNEKIIFSAEFSNPREGYLVVLNRLTGKKNWTSSKFGEQVHASPVIDLKYNVVGVGHNGGHYLGVDLVSGITKWDYYIGSPVKGTANLVNNQFCFSTWSEEFICLSSATGEVTQRWKLSGKSQSSAAYSEKLRSFFVGSSNGTILKLKSDLSSTPLQISSEESPSKSNMASPILVSNDSKETLIMPCFADSLCFIDPINMKLFHQVNVGGIITGSPVYYNNTVYVAVDDGSLVAIQ